MKTTVTKPNKGANLHMRTKGPDMPSTAPIIPHKPHWRAKIRMRTLRGYRREAQGYIAWDEYQLVADRLV